MGAELAQPGIARHHEQSRSKGEVGRGAYIWDDLVLGDVRLHFSRVRTNYDPPQAQRSASPRFVA